MALITATAQELKDYTSVVKEAGFNIDEQVGESEGIYMYRAKNADGMEFCMAFAKDQSFIAIGKDLSSLLGE